MTPMFSQTLYQSPSAELSARSDNSRTCLVHPEAQSVCVFEHVPSSKDLALCAVCMQAFGRSEALQTYLMAGFLFFINSNKPVPTGPLAPRKN